MEILSENSELKQNTFLSHVFSSNEESQAEIFNALQYSFMGVIPVVVLNKSIQQYLPDADPEKSSLEILAEIFIQLTVMFAGIIIIHRIITYFPTYSGLKYDNLSITCVILAFLIIVLSVQTKLGLKVNIMVDRAYELWNGPSYETNKETKKNVRVSRPTGHSPSQSDYLDNTNVQNDTFPPAPTATTQQSNSYDHMMPSQGMDDGYGMSMGPMAANGVVGGSFGSAF